MPIPNTRVFLSSILASNGGVKITPSTTGDFVPLTPGVPVAQWLASTADMNGDGRADLIFGEAASDISGSIPAGSWSSWPRSQAAARWR